MSTKPAALSVESSIEAWLDHPTGKRNINQIVEHWLPWQDNEAETIRLENQWTKQSIEFLRSK
jgi:hypothetical protein